MFRQTHGLCRIIPSAWILTTRNHPPLNMKAFISYSHQDAQLLDKLHAHLAAIRREGLLETWTDREIHAGGEIDREVFAAMDEAELFLLLVSASFLDSSYCYEKEFQRALEKQAAGKAVIVPLILREVDWEIPALRKFKALPDDGKPVISRHWHSDDEGFSNIAKGLRKLLAALKPNGTKESATKKTKKPKFTPDDSHVTAEQRDKLGDVHKGIVERLTAKFANLPEADFRKKVGMWSAIVWSQFNEHFNTVEFGLQSLPKERFEEAKSWLLQYRASKDKNFKRADPQKYRNTLTKAIHIAKGMLGWSDEQLYAFAIEKLEQATPITSLNDLGNNQLELVKNKIKYEQTKRGVKSKQAKAVKKPRIAKPKLEFSKELLEAILSHFSAAERGLTEILRPAPEGPLNVCFIPNITAAGTAYSVRKSVFKPAVAELLSLSWLLQPESDSNVRIYELNPQAQPTAQ